MDDTNIKIGLCKSNEDYKDEILRLFDSKVFRYIQKDIVTYENYKEIMDVIRRGEFDLDLILIELFSDNNDGIEVARLINKKQLDTDMIFISSSADNFSYGYTYKAFANLLKPITRTALESVIRMYINKLFSETLYLNIHKKNEEIRVPLQDIIYIESNVRKVIVHTNTNDISYYEKLSVLESALKPYGFARSHQSFLVSIEKITGLGNTTVELGAHSVPVSRQYREYLKTIFDGTTSEGENEGEHRNKYKDVISVDNKSDEKGENALTNSAIIKKSYRTLQSRASITGINGEYKGVMISFKSDVEIIVGRDINNSDFIVNLPKVSRVHCKILYNSSLDRYEIIDDSTNGTFINGGNRLIRHERYVLEPDATIAFGDKETVFKLG
ncbi:MAG: LytTR family transcriptional regulator DNA-binding domain-containing protein [Lachnospiraceae bacterium]|nr:LytTR family transcriptional regulator DNA-binding domain-containing protein [Lachnospiraceae bacterium]